jgi:cytochrome o ubiquinol oxidase subunit 3
MNHDFVSEKAKFGFWVYLMTDLIMFAALFATYAVLRGNSFGGPTEGELFSLPLALIETIILLTSSFTCGLAMLAVHSNKQKQAMAWFVATFVLGATFLMFELTEFSRFITDGASWQRSAFLSSFFTLVGTHGLHIAVGLLWLFVALTQISLKGLSPFVVSKLTRFALFWHFLDIIWIFIFTIVYIIGVAR